MARGRPRRAEKPTHRGIPRGGVLLLCAVCAPQADAGGTRVCQGEGRGAQGRHSHRREPLRMRRVARAAILQPQRAGRCAARRLLRQRTKLGISHLQLAAHDRRRMPVVDTPLPEHGEVFRRLPHRPRAGILPHLGHPHHLRPRPARTVCAGTGHVARGDRGLRTALPGATVHHAVHCPMGGRPRVPRACTGGDRHLPRPSARRHLRPQAAIRHGAQD